MKKISIIVPVYNEQEVLPFFYKRITDALAQLPNYDYELLFINDGSTDNSLKFIKLLRRENKKVSYINLSRNFGKEVAMMSGFDYATGDAVVIIDADLQDPPELIFEMVKYWEEGYDDVYAKRRSRQGESFLKKATASMFYKILQKSTRITIQKNTGDFRLLDRRCVKALKSMRESQRYTKGMFSWIGYNKKEILFDRDARYAGVTKWNYFKLIELAIEGITSFTTLPLRFATFAGVVVSFFAFIYLIWIVFKTLAFGETVQGFPTIMVAILFLGGIQLLFLGVIGEYVGRIFNETKKRPLYFVDEYNDEKVE